MKSASLRGRRAGHLPDGLKSEIVTCPFCKSYYIVKHDNGQITPTFCAFCGRDMIPID